MRFTVILPFVLGAAAWAAESPAPTAPLPLSLKRAVEIALAPNGNVKIQLAGEAWRQAQARSMQAMAPLLPNVDASISDQSRTVNLAAMGLKLNTLNIPIPGISFPTFVGPFNTMDARITGSQSVFDFSSIKRWQAARRTTNAALADIDSVEEQVAAQVARTYLAALHSEADLDATQANIALSQALLKQAENQKTAGTGTGIEITRARVQLANYQQRLLLAQNALRSKHLQLLRLMGLSLDTQLALTDKLAYLPVDKMTLEQAMSRALQERPDLKAQQEREAASHLAAGAAKFERLPTVAVFGDYGSIGTGLNNALPTRTYGISVRVPLFAGGRRDARRAEAASQYRVELVRTKDLRAQIELDIRLSLDELRSAEDEIKVAREGLELAENELAQARRRYEAGQTYSLEVTDAQTRLERARDNQTSALYNYNLARIDLEQAMGKARTTAP